MKPRPSKDLAGILRTLKTAKTFFLAGHERPDGDTLGSALALAHALKAKGKKAEMYTGDPIPESLSFMPGLSEFVRVQQKPKKRFDAAILLECSTPERMGNLLDLKRQAKTVINVDHHATAQEYATYNLIDAKSASNAEQVLDLLRRLKWPLTPEIGVCLWVGITTDTGRFQYDNTKPSTLRAAADLLALGIPAADINHRLFRTRSMPSLKLLGRAIDGMRLECNAKLALLTLSLADFEAAGAGPEQAEEIVNHGLMVPGVETSVLLKEGRDRVFVSLRSRGKVDVSAVAAHFGGGGHHNAAGCRIQEPLSKAALQVEAALCSAIKQALPAAA